MTEPISHIRNCTLFTLNIEDKIYRCPVSVEALYMLCRDQDGSVNQVDAYIRLKKKIQHVMERRIAQGSTEPPPVLMPIDFLGDKDCERDRERHL